MTASPVRRMWIGTYPAGGQGTPSGCGEGIWRVDLDLRTGELSGLSQEAITPSPCFLAVGHRTGLVYAVNEIETGALTVLRQSADALEPLSRAATAGAHPCHVLLHRRLDLAIVANYTSGSVAVFRLNPDGLPEHDQPDQLLEFTGSGPNPVRQEAPHAHFVLPTPSGSHLLAIDLGADVIRRFRLDTESRTLVDAGIAVALPPGAGPRHAAFATDGTMLYITGELDGRLHTIRWDAANDDGVVIASSDAQRSLDPSPQLAHLELAGDALYLGCRGSNRITEHRRQPDGTTQLVREIQLPGSCPRHHALIGGWLVVAQQEHGGVTALDQDGTPRGHADVPSPACITPNSCEPGAVG